MPAIEFNLLKPVINALNTEPGWIGLLLGLLGRETIQRMRALVASLRGKTTEQP